MENKGDRKNTILLTVIGIATLLVAIVGATFAYFSAQVTYSDSNSTLTIVSASGGSSTYQGGDSITVENIYPRTDPWVQKAIRITYGNSNTNLDYDYQLTLSYQNTFASGYLTYTLTPIPDDHATGVCLQDGSKTDSTACGADLVKSTDNGDLLDTTSGSLNYTAGATATIVLGQGTFEPTQANETAAHVYLLTISFPNAAGNQNDAQGKVMTASVLYDEVH